MVRFHLWPLLQGKTRRAKLENAYNTLIIAPRGLQYETNLEEIIHWESSDVVRFGLGPPPLRSNDGSLALVSCLSCGCNLDRFSDGMTLIKHPTRDPCLYSGGRGSAGSIGYCSSRIFYCI